MRRCFVGILYAFPAFLGGRGLEGLGYGLLRRAGHRVWCCYTGCCRMVYRAGRRGMVDLYYCFGCICSNRCFQSRLLS